MASPTTLFVEQGGSDANPCTAALQCATITRALTQLSSPNTAGNTIHVTGTITDNVAIGGTTVVSIMGPEGGATVVGSSNPNPGEPVFTISQGSTVTISNATISNGTPSYPQFPGGGGVLNNGRAYLTDDTITNNATLTAGGGVYNSATGTVVMMDDTISRNEAGDDFSPYPFTSGGGGIYSKGTLTLEDSTVAGNVDFSDPGAGIYADGSADLLNDTISGNSIGLNGNPAATNVGGGIYNASGPMYVVATTIAGDNQAVTGSGIATAASSLTYVSASIIADNLQVGMCDIGGNWVDQGWNMFGDYGDTTCTVTNSTSVQNTNPDLGYLENNGGQGSPQPTFTQEPQAGNPESPAINKIPPNTSVVSPFSGYMLCPSSGGTGTDQRGAPRPGSGYSKCTIGSVEVQGTAVVKCTGPSCRPPHHFTITLRCWVSFPCVPRMKNGSPPVAVDFYWDTTSSNPFASKVLKRNGSVKVRSVIPSLSSGVHTIVVVDKATGAEHSLDVTVSPPLCKREAPHSAGRPAAC